MGAFKPLLDLGGKPLIVRTVESLFQGGAECVTVILGYRGDEVEAALRKAFHGESLCFAWNREFRTTGMLSSIKAGLALMSENSKGQASGFFLIPADMPAVKAETLTALAEYNEQKKARVCFPVAGGQRGHPPLIAVSCIPAIMEWQGPGGLRGFWDAQPEGIAECAVDDQGCFMDADTPEDYRRLREYMCREQH